MEPCVIAYDLGTGGNKASIYDATGRCLAECFVPYATRYPEAGWHEQRPEDWWAAVVESTRRVLSHAPACRAAVVACAVSGHSLGVVPLDAQGGLLRDATPIWSDGRAGEQARHFFKKVDESRWYGLTGNGFPAALYSVFKIMWYRDHEPAMFSRMDKVIGTKDYINLKLTGMVVTDPSYASGCGVFDLLNGDYSEELVEASGLSARIFPQIVPSTEIIGKLSAEAAEALGLARGVKVAAGGVDNACMALGAAAYKEGRVYNSLGSSSWIAVSSARPVLDESIRPYVFAHAVPGLYVSATAIFSAGSTFRWVRDQFCPDLIDKAQSAGSDVYDLMTALAADSPVGANRLLFNPSLAGGSSLDVSPNVRGALIGLDLKHTRADVIRAAMEGIALGLRVALDRLRQLVEIEPRMLVVGGGSRSLLWRQIYADIYGMEIVKTGIDQQAAALGAAALAAVGSGLWSDFDTIDAAHVPEAVASPNPGSQAVYERLLPVFTEAARMHARLGDLLAEGNNV